MCWEAREKHLWEWVCSYTVAIVTLSAPKGGYHTHHHLVVAMQHPKQKRTVSCWAEIAAVRRARRPEFY